MLKSCKRGVPFTISFHPSLKHSGLVIKKNLYILYLDTEARKVFTPEPFIAFSTGRNLKNYLVREKVPSLVREKGCKKCNKPRCLTCKNIQESDTFECTVDGKHYNVNHHFNCDSKGVVYLLTCKVCKKMLVRQRINSDLDGIIIKHVKGKHCLIEVIHKGICMHTSYKKTIMV